MRRYIIGVIIILLVVVGIVVLFSRGSRNQPEQKPEVTRNATLTDYANTNTVMRYTIGGRIISNEEHRVVQITVGKDERIMEIQRGYEGAVLTRERLSNNVPAYSTFLAALQNEGYSRSRAAGGATLEEGACPTGQRFLYEIIDGSEVKQSLWSTSCQNIAGTFNGRASLVRSLFQAQIPNYEELTRSLTL